MTTVHATFAAVEGDTEATGWAAASAVLRTLKEIERLAAADGLTITWDVADDGLALHVHGPEDRAAAFARRLSI